MNGVASDGPSQFPRAVVAFEEYVSTEVVSVCILRYRLNPDQGAIAGEYVSTEVCSVCIPGYLPWHADWVSREMGPPTLCHTSPRCCQAFPMHWCSRLPERPTSRWCLVLRDALQSFRKWVRSRRPHPGEVVWKYIGYARNMSCHPNGVKAQRRVKRQLSRNEVEVCRLAGQLNHAAQGRQRI